MFFRKRQITFKNNDMTVKKLKILGTGGFSKVYLVCSDNEKLFALKRTKFKKNSLLLELVKNEINILKQICHPNIIGYYNHHILANKVYMLMEFCSFGTIEHKLFDINEAKIHLFSVSKAMIYLHSNNIIHRDISAANILLQTNDFGEKTIKLADFGLSVQINDVCGNDKSLYSNVCKSLACSGTVMYVAPEVLLHNVLCEYICATDIWSFAVLVYFLIFHKYPFEGNCVSEVIKNITKINHGTEQTHDNNAIDLVQKIFVLSPKKRITLEQMQSHPFFS